jgi:hypothetical protein
MSNQLKPKSTIDRLYKLVVYFLDGNTGRFYSNDRKGRNKVLDPTIGLIRLRRLMSSYKNKYSVALIYKTEGDELIEKYDSFCQPMPIKKEEVPNEAES